MLIAILGCKNSIDVESPESTEVNHDIDKNYYSPYKYEEEKTNNAKYKKKKIMTECEEDYYFRIKKILPPSYRLQAQIPLSSIVEKTEKDWKTPLELFRTIDFGIFNHLNQLVCLVEINDRTHLLKERIERDKKVQSILRDADIRLATIWTDESKDEEHIKAVIYKALNIH